MMNVTMSYWKKGVLCREGKGKFMSKPKKTPELPPEPKQPEIKPADPGKMGQPGTPEILPSQEPAPQVAPPEIIPGKE